METDKKEIIKSICEKVLSEWDKGNLVYADIEGLKSIKFEDFIKQPLDGMLYDINRNIEIILTFIEDPKWVNDFALTKLLEYYYNKCNELEKKLKEYEGVTWHDGKEVPHTGRIMFESTHGGFRFAYYRLESDRFDSDDECYYTGKWEHCDVKRWIYEQDLLAL